MCDPDMQKKGKKEVTYMCAGLEKLSQKTPEDILEQYGDGSCPIDIEGILKALGVHFAPMDFVSIERRSPKTVQLRGNILGAVTLIEDTVNIFYRKGSDENIKRFTLAHELGHCCYDTNLLRDRGHIEWRFDGSTRLAKEVRANRFAGKILVPEDMLQARYYQLFDQSGMTPTSDELGEVFKVDVAVIEARLKTLGLPYYSLHMPASAKGTEVND